MGLDTTHGCWHGSYSAFMRWRQKVAEVAGLPPLELMEGFFSSINSRGDMHTLYCGITTHDEQQPLRRLDARLPIRWSCLRPDPLHALLYHSDCDGDIPPGLAGKIAKRLEELLPLMPDGGGGGQIEDWRETTKRFIDGLRLAHDKKERVGFH